MVISKRHQIKAKIICSYDESTIFELKRKRRSKCDCCEDWAHVYRLKKVRIQRYDKN